MSERIIYLDNAAMSYPKLRPMLETMIETYARIGVSPGRGSYDMAAEAQELVDTTRRKIARFFGSSDPDRVIFTGNATDALNLAIQGLIEPGTHVVSTRLEHNSVLRPLYHLRRRGLIDYDLVPFDGQGLIDPEDMGAILDADFGIGVRVGLHCAPLVHKTLGSHVMLARTPPEPL